MGIFKVLIIVIIAMTTYQLNSIYTHVPIPYLEPDPWWGAGSKGKTDDTIRSFKINISDEDIEDLNTRLYLPIRLTPSLEGVNFTYGFNSETIKEIVEHWKNNYNWREREIKLNKYNHYKTKIEGLDIHFIRVKPNVANDVVILPMIIIHGWPGSFVEFMDILPILTTPQKGNNIAFEVIIPSLPGFGFSDSSTKPGLGVPQTAQIFNKLMKRIGFEKYYVQGGDWGGVITTAMGTLYSENIFGIHITWVSHRALLNTIKYLLGSILPSGFIMDKFAESRLYPISKHIKYIFRETGYFHIQATKPDTIGISLSNSPEGLAAYILGVFSTATNKDGPNKPDGGLLTDFPICLNKLLDNINIYWFTQSITTSMRFYAEMSEHTKLHLNQIPTSTPTGILVLPHEIFLTPKSFAREKFRKIITYTHKEAGGHFGAMEVPQLLAADLFNFVYAVEEIRKNDEL